MANADSDRFLAELGNRRARLLRLAGTASADAHLLAELVELSEQLLIAEEELRAQREELDDLRAALAGGHGVLVERPTGRIRDSAAGVPLSGESDRFPEPTPAATNSSDGCPKPAARAHAMLSHFGTLARTLAETRTAEQMAPAIVDAARLVLPGDGHAGLTLLAPGMTPVPVQLGWSSELARRHDAAQLAAQSGPLLEALRTRSPVSAARTGRTHGRKQGDLRVNMLAVPLLGGTRVLGALTLYADVSQRPDDSTRDAAVALAAHVAVALGRLRDAGDLQAGLAARQRVGEALGVLMERERISSEAAFDKLRRRSQRANMKLREVAQRVLDEQGRTSKRAGHG